MTLTTFRGHKACVCLAEWLPFFEAELLARGVIKRNIDIAQLIGDAEDSAGTHSTGGAFDIWQHDPVTVKVAREMGADATWSRVTGSFAQNKHTHGVLRGCPHNGAAKYQIDAVDADFNGLGRGGRGAPDDGPRPLSKRTWKEGIAWQKRQDRKRRTVLDIHVATSNIEELPMRSNIAVRADMRKIERAGAELVLWQECGNPIYWRALRALDLKAVITHAKDGYNSPISYSSRDLVLLRHTAKLFQPGARKRSKNRYLTTAFFRVVDAKPVKVVAHSGHFVAKAWRFDGSAGPRKLSREAAEQAVRQVVWVGGQKVVRFKVRRIAKRGIPQVLGLDANRARVPVLPEKIGGRKVTGVAHGLDWIFFVDGKHHFWSLEGDKELVATGSHHDTVIQRAKLIRRKRS